MARTIRLPSEQELPPGSIRDFVLRLFTSYQQAHRPTLRQISAASAPSQNTPRAVSPETIRRMLNGTTVPANWATVAAVHQALWDLAGKNPDPEVYRADRIALERAWHQAIDHPDDISNLAASESLDGE